MLGRFLLRSVQAPSITSDTIFSILGSRDTLASGFSFQRSGKECCLLGLHDDVVRGMVVRFRHNAEKVVGSVESSVLLLLTAVGVLSRIKQ